jgi:aminoglycoside phosphotransferase (APT) family kinase protein
MADNPTMERSWARAHSFVELTKTGLEWRVRAAFPDAAVLGVEQLRGGLRNSNYRLTLSGTPSCAVLRLYTADPEACAREAGVLAAVAGRVPAPRIWHSEPAADPPFALLEWLEGEAMDELLFEADAATAVELAAGCGAALAAIHEIRFPAPGFLGPDLRVLRPMPAWAPTVLSVLDGPAGERLGPELADRVRRSVESNTLLVEPVWSEAVLVHGDFKPPNLLAGSPAGPDEFSPGGEGGLGRPAGAARPRLTGILDWEFACAGSRLLDFATFLRDEGTKPAGYGDAFAAAYVAAGGIIPADWRRLMRVIDVINLLQMLAWVGGAAAATLRDLVSAGLRETATP